MSTSAGSAELPLRSLDNADHFGQSARVETVAVTAEGPLLEGVFGSLSAEDERVIRQRVLAIGENLKALAAEVGGRVGWLGAGVELHWLPSGQTSLLACVETQHLDDRSLALIAELRPSWCFGEKRSRPSWIAELSVEVDCGHSEDHERHVVVEEPSSASTALAACDGLAAAVQRLRTLVATESVGGLIALGQQ
jgi:hypothetical protein